LKKETIQQLAARLGSNYITHTAIDGGGLAKDTMSPDGCLIERHVFVGDELTYWKARRGAEVLRKRKFRSHLGLFAFTKYLDAWLNQGDKRVTRWVREAKRHMSPKMWAKVSSRWPIN
jgi:hypothetical protein